MTNLVQFPGLGLSFELSRVAFSIGDMDIYWYGVCIAFGLCLALVFAFRRCTEFGIDADSMVDVILIGVVLGIAGGLACKWRGVPVLPMFDLAGMGFLIGQGCGRWGNFFNQEAFGCNTTLPWGMFSEATEDYLMGSTVTVPKGVTIDPAMPVHPTFLYESIWCFVGLALLVAYIKKRKFNGDIALRYLVWYGAGRFWIESLRTDSLLLVPSLGLRASQLVAAAAVVGGVALEIFLTRKYKSKPLMVTLALTAENRSLLAKVHKAEPEFTVEREELVASSPRKLFLERTNAYNERVKQQLKEKLEKKN